MKYVRPVLYLSLGLSQRSSQIILASQKRFRGRFAAWSCELGKFVAERWREFYAKGVPSNSARQQAVNCFSWPTVTLYVLPLVLLCNGAQSHSC